MAEKPLRIVYYLGFAMIDYTMFYKTTLSLDEPWPSEARWDVFLSAFTAAERLRWVFDKANAVEKHWLVFPQYQFLHTDHPAGSVFASDSVSEADFIQLFWDSKLKGIDNTASICIDTTGFIRPFLMFLVRWLMVRGFRIFEAIYSEPVTYARREETRFSDEMIEQVRQVAGFEGNHLTDNSRDVLIIGSGYDHELIARVAENKDQARKIQIFGFPSLRADMYQENVLRAHRAEEAVGGLRESADLFFAPANDPFVTASVLQQIVKDLHSRNSLGNLYLSPLATKAQVLGFALYYVTECRNTPTSIIFPFSPTYNQETSKGIARIWKYTVELPAP